MKAIRNKVVLLFSGGYDSTLLLKLALEMELNPLCLLIDYGQVHVEELDYAKKLVEESKVDWCTVKVEIPAPANLLENKRTYEGVDPHHVPARNLIFIGLAASLAEGYDIPLIWYGANYQDREKFFPDCYQEWVYEMNKVLAINGSSKITVEAPLLGMSKETITRLAWKYGINKENVFSGYEKDKS